MSGDDLDKLRADIKHAREISTLLPKVKKTKDSDTKHTNMRAGGELIGGVLGGLMFGYAIDYMFGTAPFGLIICLLGGITAGFYGVYRATK